MAAPSGIVWGDIYGDNRGRIGIYTSVSSTNTATTVNVQVWVWTRASTTDSSNNLYFDCGVGITSASTNVGSVTISHTVNTSWSTSNQTKIYDKSFTYSRGKSAVTYTVQSKLQGVDWVGAIMYAKTTFTVPALSSYTVSYNANNGTSAPSSQTKWYGENLTLSTSKPTRTGYSFSKWLSSAQNQYYDPGDLYGHNESTTMVAQWIANTYTISYDANGGSGAPESQTKTYDVTLTLSSVIPTRANYNFLGWAASSSATTATYSAGGSYTANTAITLYAVWELAYIKPRITNYTVDRCDSEGNISDTGTYAHVCFNWATDYACTDITISWGSSSDSGSTTVTASGTSGNVDVIIGNNSISPETVYTITVSVSDSNGNTPLSTTLNGTAFAIDFRTGGKGVAIGKPSEIDAFEVAMTQYDKFGTLVGNGLAAYSGAGDAGIDPNTTLEGLCLTSHANAPQGLGTFYYILTVFYNTKSETAARAQIAYPYKKNGSSYHRYYSSGEWSTWNRYMTADEVYPVNSIYISYSNTSPAELFGGTWHRMESRFLWGCPSTSEIGLTAGEMTHTLTTSEIPSHNHMIYNNSASGSNSAHVWSTTWKTTADSSSMKGSSISWAGGGAAHNNMPPYVNVAIWRRTA